MADVRTAAVMEALASVYDPCCQEKGLSVVDMGLGRRVDLDGGGAQVEVVPTTGRGLVSGRRGLRRRARPPWHDRLHGREGLGRALDDRPALRQGPAHPALPAPPQGGRPVIGDDAIVFDGVAHVFNFEKKNALGPPGEMFINHLYAFHNALTPEDQPLMTADEFLRQWTVDDIDEMVYRHSSTDMLCAMPLPLTDLF